MDIIITNLNLTINLNILKNIEGVTINFGELGIITLNEKELFETSTINLNEIIVFLKNITCDLTKICDLRKNILCTITIFYFDVFRQREIQRFSIPIKTNNIFNINDYRHKAGSLMLNLTYKFTKSTQYSNYDDKYIIFPIILNNNIDNLDFQALDIVKMYNINVNENNPPFVSNIRISYDKYDNGIYVFFSNINMINVPIVRREIKIVEGYDYNYSSCWESNAQILTTEGWKQSTDITTNDIVVTDIGRSTILSIEKSKKEMCNMYQINNILLTSGHPYLLNNKWVRPDETGTILNKNFESVVVYNLNLENDHCVYLKNKNNTDDQKILVATNGKFSNWFNDTKPL